MIGDKYSSLGYVLCLGGLIIVLEGFYTIQMRYLLYDASSYYTN